MLMPHRLTVKVAVKICDAAVSASQLNNLERSLMIEWVMPTPEDDADPFTFWETTSMDLNMLAIHGGGGWRVRTSDEFGKLLEAGGFTLKRIIPTTSSVSVLECVAA